MVWPVAAGSLPRQRLVTSAGTVRSFSGQRELRGSALSLVYPAESVGGCAGLFDGKGNSVNTPLSHDFTRSTKEMCAAGQFVIGSICARNQNCRRV